MKTVSLPRGRHRLHTMPTSTGYEIRDEPSYDWNGRKRGQTPFTVLQHTVAGVGNLLYERRRYRLRPGDTMLVIVPHNHRYWVEDGERWEFFWISMSGQEAVRIHRTIQAATGPVLRLRPETIEHIADCCLRLIEGKGETPGAASAIAYEAVGALYDDVFGSQSALSVADEDNAVRRVVEHVRANLDKPLDRSRPRRGLRLQPGPFLAHVRGERRRAAGRIRARRSACAAPRGCSPAIRFCRSRRSPALTGFDDPNYFAKVFRRFFGTSPTEFRTTGMYATTTTHTLGQS